MSRSDLPLTLFQIGGGDYASPDLANSVLIMIDFQNEHLAGPLALKRAFDAVDQAVRLLWAARDAGGRVVYVVHAGGRDGLFDRSQYRGALIGSLKRREG